MPFVLRMGVSEVEQRWNDLSLRKAANALDKNEERLFKRLVKVIGYLPVNPLHNSLRSDEIDALTKRYGFKVFQSYLEDNTPAAGRLFWTYGPRKGEITILG